jgi:hypothetical protein
MKDSRFKSVIFFGISEQPSHLLIQSIKAFEGAKVFSTPHYDELLQIIDMSSKAVIITDNLKPLKHLIDHPLQGKKRFFRVYHADWLKSLSKIEQEKLLSSKITVFKSTDKQQVLDKIELYLFGKVNVFKSGYFEETAPLFKSDETRSFFTMMELSAGGWKVVTSSHEREEEISELIGKNWETFLEDVLAKAHTFNQIVENKIWNKPYFEIIFPHWSGEKIHKVSIVHLSLDEKLSQNLEKVKKFLQSI